MNNNPLKQYFRRPAVYLKLPSGGVGYGPEVLELPETGELPVYPMTAIDEITAKTPDALFNGSAVTELIKSCVPAIKDPWAINSVDLDSILIAIKAAGGTSSLEVESKCPKCSSEGTYGVNLVAVLSTLKSGDYSKELELGDLSVKLRPLTYKEMNAASMGQFELQKLFQNVKNTADIDEKNKITELALRKVTELTMEILTQAIEYVKTPNTVVTEKEFIEDFLQNCDKNTYNAIRDHNTALKTATELKPLEITCSDCNHFYKQPYTLNPTDFFG